MTPLLADAARRAARRHGTPLVLTDLARLDADARALAAAFPDPWLRLYALKANGLPALIRRLPDLGYGATAVSRGELSLARRAGFPLERTALEGIGKGDADLRAAIDAAVEGSPLLWVSLESADEAAALARRAARSGVRLDVLVRVNPMVQPETHRGLAVGAAASKFGVLADELPELDPGWGRSGRAAALARAPPPYRLPAGRGRCVADGLPSRPATALAPAGRPAGLRHARCRLRLPGGPRNGRLRAADRAVR